MGTFGEKRMVVTIKPKRWPWGEVGYYEIKAGDKVQGYIKNQEGEWQHYGFEESSLTSTDILLLGEKIDRAATFNRVFYRY
jgi:hypothetical protein